MSKKRKILSKLLAVCLLFTLSFTSIAGTSAVDANAAARINMNIFKKQSTRSWLPLNRRSSSVVAWVSTNTTIWIRLLQQYLMCARVN